MIVIFELLSFLKYQKQRFYKKPRYLLTRRMIKFLQRKDASVPFNLKERKRIIKFLRRHLVEGFNYLITKCIWRRVKVELDKNNGLHYVYTDEGHRLYAKRGSNFSTIVFI
jgi:hypothetical protein